MFKKSTSLLVLSLVIFAASSTAYAGYKKVSSLATISFANSSNYYTVTGKGTATASGSGNGTWIHVTSRLDKNGDLYDYNFGLTDESNYISVPVKTGKEGDAADWYFVTDAILSCDWENDCYVHSSSDDAERSHPGT